LHRNDGRASPAFIKVDGKIIGDGSVGAMTKRLSEFSDGN
jgi:hypothetical protein